MEEKKEKKKKEKKPKSKATKIIIGILIAVIILLLVAMGPYLMFCGTIIWEMFFVHPDKPEIEKAEIPFEHVIADENRELVEQFDIHQAPTLVVVKNGVAEKIVNLSNIRKYIEEQK